MRCANERSPVRKTETEKLPRHWFKSALRESTAEGNIVNNVDATTLLAGFCNKFGVPCGWLGGGTRTGEQVLFTGHHSVNMSTTTASPSLCSSGSRRACAHPEVGPPTLGQSGPLAAICAPSQPSLDRGSCTMCNHGHPRQSAQLDRQQSGDVVVPCDDDPLLPAPAEGPMGVFLSSTSSPRPCTNQRKKKKHTRTHTQMCPR